MHSSEADYKHGLIIPHRAKIGLANDHAGFPLKGFVKQILAPYCDEVVDLGATSDTPVDFPDVTERATTLITEGKVDRLVLLCGTGAGACIVANKVKGIRAAVCHDTFVARQAVEHDDVNVICIGAWIIGPQVIADVLRTFLAAQFSLEPHFRRRVEKISAIDNR